MLNLIRNIFCDKRLKPWCVLMLMGLLCLTHYARAQKPNISYESGVKNYHSGVVITPLIPNNTGGTVPANNYGDVSTLALTGLNFPEGLAVDAQDNIFVTIPNGHIIEKITPAGIVTTFAGSSTSGYKDDVGTAAQFNNPVGIST